MSIRAVLLPVFVQVALTFVLLFWPHGLRSSGNDQVPGGYRSELELPVLFYVLTIFAWDTKFADLFFLLLAWVFVALRVLHAYAGSTSQGASGRDALFISSAIVLAVMWVVYAVRILLGIG